MTLDEMKAEAFSEVRLDAEADCLPVILNDLESLIDRCQRAVIWEAETDYEFGDVVQLSPRNGHRYQCVTAGTSGDSSEDWLTSVGARITDGTAIWVEDGADYPNVYDKRKAKHLAWMLKAAKSTHLVDRSSGDDSVSASQLQAHCRKRAAEYAPLGFA